MPFRSACLMFTILMFGSVAVGQRPTPAAAPVSEGYFLSDALLDTIVKRWAFELADNIDLTEAEEAEVREALKGRWGPFFKNHQDQLAPVIEGYMKAMLDPDPPSKEDVQAWAKRAIDLQDQILEQLNRTEEEITQLLPPDKIGRFKGEFAQIRVGMGYMNTQARKWETGEFDASYWDKIQQRRVDRRNRHRERWQKEEDKALEQLVTLSKWDGYVNDFIARFDLDAAQRTSATAVLTDVKQRARSYIDSHEHDIQQTSGELKTAEHNQRGTMLARRQELLEPLQSLFDELQSRLDDIPTEAQRARESDDHSEQKG